MNIRYGKHTVETVYVDGQPRVKEFIQVRTPIKTDADELKEFIRMQRDAKECGSFTFERETRTGGRYIIRRIEVVAEKPLQKT